LEALRLRLSAERSKDRRRQADFPNGRGAASDPPDEIPGTVRRDRHWNWSDWFVVSGMCAAAVIAGWLLGVYFPVGETTQVALRGNLDANAPAWTAVHTFVEVFDSQNQVHRLGLIFTKQVPPNTWNLRGRIDASEGRMIAGTVAGLTFNEDGAFARVIDHPPTMTFQIAGLTAPQTVRFDFGTPGKSDGLTQRPEAGPPPHQLPLLAWAAGAPPNGDWLTTIHKGLLP